MTKCDVILPIHNAPEYVELCMYALFKNTEETTLGKVYLINDKSDEFTENLLLNLKKKYAGKVILVNNESNLGFVKSVNKGLKLATSDYILLLNSDCFIANKTIEKLIQHVNNNEKIGLICPISNNSANISLDMFPGFSYIKMDKLLENKFRGMSMDACTVVGNCLMITKRCIKETGYLDEIYGIGYGEESDYQMKAMQKGFEAKVAIDTYVFHKSKKSFNDNSSSNLLRKNNLKLFLDRWGNEYHKLLSKYKENDPIEYIKNCLSKEDKKIEYDYLFVLLGLSETAGGVKVIIDIINYLCINGINIGMINLRSGQFNEVIVFDIINGNKIDDISAKFFIGTIYSSMFYARKLADKYNAETIYFAQGYEFAFDNGKDYGKVELSFKMADYIITISSFLKEQYHHFMNLESKLIANGVFTDLLVLNRKKKNRQKTITAYIRDIPLKGDFILIDILKKITTEFSNLNLNLIMNKEEIILGVNNNNSIKINKIFGPLTRTEIYKILQKSDIYIDTSLIEGFSLLPLESMASSTVPVLSNSFGIAEYAIHEENSIIIDEVNNPEKYLNAIKSLLEDEAKLRLMQKRACETAQKFDFDLVIEEYLKFFKDLENKKIHPLEQKFDKKYLDLLSNYLISDNELNQIHKQKRKIKIRRKTRLKLLLKRFAKFTIASSREFYHILRNR